MPHAIYALISFTGELGLQQIYISGSKSKSHKSQEKALLQFLGEKLFKCYYESLEWPEDASFEDIFSQFASLSWQTPLGVKQDAI